MSTALTNYAGVIVPDIGDPNNTGSGQVSGGVSSVAIALDTHDHTIGKGLPVNVPGGVDVTADFNMSTNGVIDVGYIQYIATTPGPVPNLSLYVSDADNKLYWRDGSGTDKLVTTVPAQ